MFAPTASLYRGVWRGERGVWRERDVWRGERGVWREIDVWRGERGVWRERDVWRGERVCIKVYSMPVHA